MPRFASCLAVGIVAVAVAGAATAQIALFEHDDFNGRTFRAVNSVANLDQSGFNDRASSAIVSGGRWQLCSDGYFRGNCVTLGVGRYPSLRVMDLNDRVSSVRELGWTPDGGGGWSGGSGSNNSGGSGGGNSGSGSGSGGNNHWGGGGHWGSGSRAILFDGQSLSGNAFVVSPGGINSLADVGFNDRASSLRVEAGYWLFCSDANFQGECRTFGPGDYPSLPSGLSRRISSGRRISSDYPYRSNPSWGNN